MSDVFARQDFDRSDKYIQVICCPNCESPLAIHQPDPGLPDRLLATCDDCKSWYVLGAAGSRLNPITYAR